jgi:cytochrome c553
MNRLIVFSFLMVALVTVLTLKNYKSLPISNEKFSMTKAEEAHASHIKELEELEARQKPVVKVVVDDKPQAPLVVLDTPQLKSGSTLYKKCIVCHGKSGEGKKSQNAPRIGGQFASYLEDQIMAMKSGKRINQKMLPYIKKLSSQDVKDLSAYLSKIPWGK